MICSLAGAPGTSQVSTDPSAVVILPDYVVVLSTTFQPPFIKTLLKEQYFSVKQHKIFNMQVKLFCLRNCDACATPTPTTTHVECAAQPLWDICARAAQREQNIQGDKTSGGRSLLREQPTRCHRGREVEEQDHGKVITDETHT